MDVRVRFTDERVAIIVGEVGPFVGDALLLKHPARNQSGSHLTVALLASLPPDHVECSTLLV